MNRLVSAQSISTSIQVPPLQWINLTGLLSGPAPPPLKDASIGYDDTSRSLLIFGGESQQGIPQSQTYLLDLSKLTWSTPTSPGNLQRQPPARSGAISAQDIAASYRTGHVVFGGRGVDGQPLSDVWEYSFNVQFWTQVSVSGDGPSARWAAAGGNDIRAQTIQGPVTPNNSFYVAGGFDSKGAISLSDLWQFNITGTLSANLPNDVVGSWEKLSLSNGSLPAIGGSATAAVFQSPNQFISAIGGCSTSSSADASCAMNSTYTLNLGAANGQSFSTCPAPRVGSTLATNLNSASSTFNSQVFQLLGTFDSSQWQDDGGLSKGEDVFDIQTGQWARILPAGDPANGQVSYPSPREGAVAVGYTRALVGPETSRDSASDTIVFGGRDASGNYLSEVWLLRAYNGVITQSNQHWSGYKSGNLQSGVNADGEGVTITYMPKCASFIGKTAPPTSSSTSSTSSQSSPTNGQPASPSNTGVVQALPINLYDTSTTHKVLAPVSVAVAFPAALIYRLSLAPIISSLHAASASALVLLAAVLASSSFAIGIAGLATAFTSITYNTSLAKRSSVPTLPTAHAKAGIALFAGMYVVFAVTLCLAIWRGWQIHSGRSRSVMRTRTMSNDMAEKVGLYQGRAASPGPHELSAQAQPEAHSSDHTNSSLWLFFGHGNSGRRSSESGSASADRTPSPSNRSFEVMNRPTRARRASAHSLAAFSDPRSTTTSPHNLSDMSWVFPRRSSSRLVSTLYLADGLDDSRRVPDPSTPGTAVMEIRSTKGLMDNPSSPVHPELPSALEALLHILLQAFLLALCILSLIALWQRAPKATFIIFLIWTVGFYVLVFALAWNGIPRVSLLSVLVNRLRTNPSAQPSRDTTSPDGGPFSNGQGPYQNQPSYRAANESDYPTSLSHAGHTIDDYDDDEDDDTRQRRMEDEMSRRDVNIITVPKRKLVPKNPDPEHS
ncbi:hypothetical protein BDY19DRAFT_884931 [Irpex rosettiformis]|uniref:Uncharacterized protein n=1 Tax=Irpex rosettiformis TaxID=378272 RepID=A0ACB8UD13_9APHY|nr:hypothetical protein BDY19DRAFT_884931 [Irpex rosettiformis]